MDLMPHRGMTGVLLKGAALIKVGLIKTNHYEISSREWVTFRSLDAATIGLIVMDMILDKNTSQSNYHQQ